MRPVEKEIRINGVAGHQFIVNQTGYLDHLFQVYASTETQANILSLAEVEGRDLVTYISQESFIVHLPEGVTEFCRRDGLYIADWNEVRNIFMTSVCTKAEEAPAQHAYTNCFEQVDSLL